MKDLDLVLLLANFQIQTVRFLTGEKKGGLWSSSAETDLLRQWKSSLSISEGLGGYSRQQLSRFNSSMAAKGRANIPNNPRMNVTACSLQVEVY